MAQNNTKTPAMVLQELTVKLGFSPPEYITEHCKTGTHINEFYYRVDVAGIVAKGFGRSKQVAKHNAASNALQILAENGLYDPGKNPVHEFKAQAHRNESDSPFKPALNFIGLLKDLCAENKLPYPVFEEISDVGPPHCRIFTYQCHMESMRTQATANTKKQAKQLAAKDMLDKINNIYPKIGEQGPPPVNALTENEKVVKTYFEINPDNDIIPNRAAKVEEFSHTIKKIMISKDLTMEDFKEEFMESNLDNLIKILEKLEIKYHFHTIQEIVPNVVLTLLLDTPFAVINIDPDLDKAKANVVKDALRYLKIHMEVDI